MPKNPIIHTRDLTTGEPITREMTDAEVAQDLLDKENDADRTATLEARALAKSDLLAKLGITEDEAQLLLS